MGRRERCTEPECPYVGKRPPQDGCECARDEMPEEDREPTDDELYNRHGMEGGIPYDTSGDTRDEHDPTL